MCSFFFFLFKSGGGQRQGDIKERGEMDLCGKVERGKVEVGKGKVGKADEERKKARNMREQTNMVLSAPWNYVTSLHSLSSLYIAMQFPGKRGDWIPSETPLPLPPPPLCFMASMLYCTASQELFMGIVSSTAWKRNKIDPMPKLQIDKIRTWLWRSLRTYQSWICDPVGKSEKFPESMWSQSGPHANPGFKNYESRIQDSLPPTKNLTS